MPVTVTPAQLQILQSDEFLELLDSNFRDHFQVQLREATSGNYATINFGYGASTVIAALRQLAANSPDTASDAEQLSRQIGPPL